MQFDYGLRQKRYLKVEDRPKEFKSATGKTIIANHSVAVGNDKVTQRGKVSNSHSSQGALDETRLVRPQDSRARIASGGSTCGDYNR